MEKILVVGICLLALLITDYCIYQNTEIKSASSQISGQISNQEYPDSIGEIMIEDMDREQYQNPLEVRLSANMVKEFNQFLPDLQTEPGKMLAKPFYRIRLIEEKYTTEWTVCADHSVYSKEGRVYTENDALDNWLKDIEASAGFDHSMLDRAPGDNHLCLMDEAERAEINEITENNFVEGTSFALNEEEYSEFGDILTLYGVSFSRKPVKNLKEKYRISVYSENGAELYLLFLDQEGYLYTNTGYQILCGNSPADREENRLWFLQLLRNHAGEGEET